METLLGALIFGITIITYMVGTFLAIYQDKK
jgi:hypothetical protein